MFNEIKSDMPKMFDDIDLFKSDIIIRCSELNEPSDIYSIMKNSNSRDYAYAISYITGEILNPVIKIGMSSPKKDRKNNIMGERIVRQISHLEGWKTKPISNHGADLISGLKTAIHEMRLPEKAIHRDNCIIYVWNVRFRACKSQASIYEQTYWIEGELCRLHKKHFGKLPPLNTADPSESLNFKKPRLPTTKKMPNVELFKFG